MGNLNKSCNDANTLEVIEGDRDTGGFSRLMKNFHQPLLSHNADKLSSEEKDILRKELKEINFALLDFVKQFIR